MIFSMPPDCKNPEEQREIASVIKSANEKLGAVWKKHDKYQRGEKKRYVFVDLTVDTWGER